MQKTIFIVSLVLVFVFSLFIVSASVSFAKQNDNFGQVQQQVQQQKQKADQGETTQVQTQTQNMEQAENENDEDNNENNNEASSSTQNRQQKRERDRIDIEEHRSAVSDFVQGLLSVADREGGIGQQVKIIAQQQNQSASTTTQAVEKIQTRSKIKTFFFGSDYKNLGALRSEMVQTRNRLEQLNRLMENIQNEGDKTELQNKIQTLEQEQEKINEFLEANENKFSLFGWFTRLFVK
ncbi:hypothetical protein A3J77_02200 [Candidatus Wolfebacteria bacterium RBG_13_41_7]|uniref:DUF5667 domain-containing protein n=1 Tax=Candidatus Wolfebacteria bacterium RBG_13_41_7 TaxID=1802554 RepID=A0A1F8DL66_9BACT|nr:MAG: hypothetical protein A3J77_02200 [Candidatus Wolfebacteria bacterium RBG_13_41_7]